MIIFLIYLLLIISFFSTVLRKFNIQVFVTYYCYNFMAHSETDEITDKSY